MKRILAIALVLGSVGCAAAQANAGWGISINSGYGGYGYSNYPAYGYGGYGVAPLYRAPQWHDTTHYDYHPTTVYRHGDHLHVQPGHYDLHRSGHWHR